MPDFAKQNTLMDIIKELKRLLKAETQTAFILRYATTIAILEAIARGDSSQLDIIVHSDFVANLLP